MRYKQNGVELSRGQTVTLPDGGRMSYQSLELWTQAERLAVGIVDAPEPPPPPSAPPTPTLKLDNLADLLVNKGVITRAEVDAAKT